MKQPYVVPSTARRDLFLGLAIGLTIMILAIWALSHVGNSIAGSTLDGVIVAKNFTPLAEEQVTFGKKGVHSRKIDGEYVLECDVKGRAYLVTVDKETYNLKKVGDHFVFARPQE